MIKLNNDDLKQVSAGGFGTGLLIGAGIVFIIGVIDGYIRPLSCH